VSTEYFI